MGQRDALDQHGVGGIGAGSGGPVDEIGQQAEAFFRILHEESLPAAGSYHERGRRRRIYLEPRQAKLGSVSVVPAR